MADHHERERAILQLASTQHGIITRAQALTLGLTEAQILYRVRIGRWERLSAGIYRMGGTAATAAHRLAHAWLSAGPRACVSHTSAAWLRGLGKVPERHHLTVPTSGTSRSRLAHVHRSDLGRGDRVTIDGFLCTSPARTVVDCAGLLGQEALGELVDAAIVGGLTTADHIRRVSDRVGRHRGRLVLREALDHWDGPIQHDSVAEARLLRMLRLWQVPPPATQHVVRHDDGGFVARLDQAWPDRRRYLEYDGGQWHSPRHVERDERREQELEALGWRGDRVTRLDLRAGSDLRERVTRLLRPDIPVRVGQDRESFSVFAHSTAVAGCQPTAGRRDVG